LQAKDEELEALRKYKSIQNQEAISNYANPQLITRSDRVGSEHSELKEIIV
jgi:hypothetical protein